MKLAPKFRGLVEFPSTYLLQSVVLGKTIYKLKVMILPSSIV